MVNGGAQSGDARSGEVRRVRRVAEGRRAFAPYGLLPLLGLACVFLFGILPFAQSGVERVAERTARQALADIGANWARVDVSGQWATIRGEAPSGADAARAVNAVRNAKARTLFGAHYPVTRVTEAFRVAAPAGPDSAAASPSDTGTTVVIPDWRFTLKDGLLTLEGDVQDNAAKARLLEAARLQIYPPRITGVDDRLTVTGAAAPVGVSDVALRGVGALGRCDSGVAGFSSGVFSLQCELPAALADDVEAMATAPLSFGRLGKIEILSRESVMSCERALSDLLTARIEFAAGSARIGTDSQTLLDDIAEVAEKCPGTLRIEGHTDNTGRSDLNEALSLRRARAVREALIRRGVPGDNLIATGFGASSPVASNETASGRAANRRIEIRVDRSPN